MLTSTDKASLAILGGTGDLGGGLAKRWAKAGYTIFIGSRDAEKASATASQLNSLFSITNVQGCGLREAAERADVIVLTVPFKHQLDTLSEIKEAVQNKIVIDVTVPLVPPKVGTVQMPTGGSAALIAQQFLGENVSVVSAFQNVSAVHLNSDHAIDCDVLVTGNNKAARTEVITLVEAAGLRAWHAGPLANSVATEALTSVLIHINNNYKLDGAGIRITGEKLPDQH